MGILAALAKKKKLPINYLKSLGVESQGEAVAIHYRRADGSEARLRLRTSLDSKNGFRWDRDGEIVPYGLWMPKREELMLVEGESDCWTLWREFQPALGIPGANSAKCLKLEHLSGVRKIYLWQENDKGGEAFIHGCLKRLHETGWKGESFILGDSGCKDPSDLYVKDQKGFAKTIRYLKARARPVKYEPPPKKEYRPKPGLNGDLVARAKAVPFSEITEVFNGAITCPFHEDTNPSASVRLGFGHCFACGKNFDSIDYIQKTKQLKFMDAVRYLCGK